MSQWSAWDWIAYGCLAIAAFGVALWKEFPKVFEQWTGLAGAIWSFFPAGLVVIATGIFIVRLWAKPTSKVEPLVDRSELRMQSYGDERVPTVVSQINVWRWFYGRNIFQGFDPTGNPRNMAVAVSLFVSFDKPTKVGTMTVHADFRLPRYEVKEFNNRFAVIWFSEDLPAGSFKIETF